MNAKSVVQTSLLPDITGHAFRENSAHGFIYLNNPKVGCSSIKHGLWYGVTGKRPSEQKLHIHTLEGSPFNNKLTNPVSARKAFIFTFVRNPFQRLVSAYLNKVHDRSDRIWRLFARAHGLNRKDAVSFDGFVELLSGIPAVEHDRHWRPQYLNTLYPFVRPNLLGDLESLDAQLPMILDRLFPGAPRRILKGRSHSTKARATWRDYYGDQATLDRVLQIYGTDFEAFGYQTKIAADPACLRGPVIAEHEHIGLAKYVAYENAAPSERPAALNALEAADYDGAIADWIVQQREETSAVPQAAALAGEV